MCRRLAPKGKKNNVQDMLPKVVAVVAVVAVMLAAVRGRGEGGRRRPHHRHGRHHYHHHRHHRTLVYASEFAEVRPGYGQTKSSNIITFRKIQKKNEKSPPSVMGMHRL